MHLFGHPVDMDRLMQIARKHALVVIEDCAESHGATVRGRMTGSFGDMGCFSFYANKIITTGEGGMVVTNDDRLADQVRLLRNLGFHQASLPARGGGLQLSHDRVSRRRWAWPSCGRSSRIVDAKRDVARRYTERLADGAGLEDCRSK